MNQVKGISPESRFRWKQEQKSEKRSKIQKIKDFLCDTITNEPQTELDGKT